jgi:hypothetical protein
MIIGHLTNDEFEFINNSLSQNGGMSNLESESLSLRHPYAFPKEGGALILSSMEHYGLYDQNLNSFILNRFGKPEYGIDFFYKLTYNVGDYTNPHLDRYFVTQTTLVLLSENFTGGRLLINKDDVHFNRVGTYINFNGSIEEHEVTKVDSGIRSVLVIMFNNKKTII